MKIKLQDVRLSFPDLFTAVQYQGAGAFRYNASFFIEKGSANHKIVSDAILEVAKEAWKGKAEAMIEEMKTNSNKFCFTNGDTKNYEGAEGCMVLASHRKQSDGRPGTYGRGGGKDPVTEADGVLYSGCYVNATVDIWAQTKENVGVRCTLLGVQFNRDGDAFSGAPSVKEDDFEDLSGGDAPDLI